MLKNRKRGISQKDLGFGNKKMNFFLVAFIVLAVSAINFEDFTIKNAPIPNPIPTTAQPTSTRRNLPTANSIPTTTIFSATGSVSSTTSSTTESATTHQITGEIGISTTGSTASTRSISTTTTIFSTTTGDIPTASTKRTSTPAIGNILTEDSTKLDLKDSFENPVTIAKIRKMIEMLEMIDQPEATAKQPAVGNDAEKIFNKLW